MNWTRERERGEKEIETEGTKRLRKKEKIGHNYNNVCPRIKIKK